jgi:hypothetical protein
MLDFSERNVFTGDVPIKNWLVPHIPTFNDDVVHQCRKARVTNEGQDEVVDIFLSMTRWHPYNFEGLKSFQDRRDRRFRDRVLSVADGMAG